MQNSVALVQITIHQDNKKLLPLDMNMINYVKKLCNEESLKKFIRGVELFF